jgi:cysteine desulfurase/selenocysteine lyase
MTGSATTMALDVAAVRADFPIFERLMADGRPLVYLDSGSTSQKPRQVIDAMMRHYEWHNANVARAVNQLGAEATEAFEAARAKVAAFIGAVDRDEIVFTSNATAALNLLANVLVWAGQPVGIGAGDEVVITEMEHHSNLVPWQLACERTGGTLRWLGFTDDGRLDLSAIEEVINERTKVVSLVWVSNVLGTINPITQIAHRAHQVGALVVVDATQAIPRLPVDVAALGADFVAFTGHKMCGPTGIGLLWGRKNLLVQLPPFLGGGGMIEHVWMQRSTYAAPPQRFEAGTPPIAEAIGLGAAVGYLSRIGMDHIAAHEQALTTYALQRLKTVDGLSILGPDTAVDRVGTISFALEEIPAHKLSQVLDSLGIAVRAGHHCALPTHAHFGMTASTRASFYLYTTPQEIDALIDGLQHAKKLFHR